MDRYKYLIFVLTNEGKNEEKKTKKKGDEKDKRYFISYIPLN